MTWATMAVFIALRWCKHPGTSDLQALSEWENLGMEKQLMDAMDECYFLGKDERARVKDCRKICGELKLPQYH